MERRLVLDLDTMYAISIEMPYKSLIHVINNLIYLTCWKTNSKHLLSDHRLVTMR